MGSIRFAGELPPLVVLGGAAIVAAAVMWFYLRETRGIASPYSYLLPALRAAAVAMTILILAGPVWHRREVVGTMGRVTFAVDTSSSMSINDASKSSASPDRLTRVLRYLAGDSDRPGWLESLSKSHWVEVVAFDQGQMRSVWSNLDEEDVPAVFDLKPDGRRTNLALPLRDSAAETPSAEQDVARSALVLLSDGRDNLGALPSLAAESFASSDTVVHTVGFGSEDEPAELLVQDVIRPETVASDGTLRGEIVVRKSQIDQSTFKVRIESDGQTIWQQAVDAPNDGLIKVPFELDVESVLERINNPLARGVERRSIVLDLKAAVESVEGDTSSANNALSFRVGASTRDRQLLILDGSSRWEVRYLRNLFSRDPAWSVDLILYGPGTDQEEVVRGENPGQFPDSREAMARYDAIILGQIPPDQLTAADAGLLREFVSRGGGLIVVDGRYRRIEELADGPLRDLIPVTYQQGSAMDVASLQPSRVGIDHPVLNLWGDRDQLAEFWKNLKSPPTAPLLQAKQDAEVWAHAVGTDDRQSPWLVTRLYGAGRVFYLSTDQTWRWRYKVADRFHSRFWNQLLQAAMQPPYAAADQYVALGTDQIEYDTGESATIRVRLQDNAGDPIGDATVDALLVANNEVVQTVPMMVDNAARGTYRAQTPALADGQYKVRVRASGFDAQALLATTPIWVGSEDTVELAQVSLDSQTMQQIATVGGGSYFHESSGDRLLDVLQPLSSGRIIESDILIWQSFYWFWAIMILLSLEWLLRKKAGLV